MAAVLACDQAAAQHITIDGSLSPAQTLAGPNYTIGANLGKQVGGNLFQSFGKFGLSNGESANFTGPATVDNIIGRVTGGSQSSIDGTLKSSIAGANLYLINPSGIVFGPNAAVNVTGSFRAATADYLKTADGARFQATNPSGSTLSAAAPAAFGFLSAAPPAITANGSVLTVPRGQTLGLAGGTVNIAGATLQASAGVISLTGVASTGEIRVAPKSGLSSVRNHGPVNITLGSLLDVSDAADMLGGGSILVRANNLTVDNAELNADNYGATNRGRLRLSGDNNLSIVDNAYVHAQAMSSGNGASIVLKSKPSGTVTVDNSTVAVGSTASGNGGALTATAGGITLSNDGTLSSTVTASGNGGPITLNAASLSIAASPTDGSKPVGIVSENGGTGNGSNVAINVTGPVSITNPFTNPFGGVSTFTDPGSIGAGGSISLIAGSLSMFNGNLSTVTQDSGTAGNISVGVAGMLSLSFPSVNEALNESTVVVGGGIGSASLSGGNAGQTSITAGNLTITDLAAIGSVTFGAGNTGSTSIDVTGLLSIDAGPTGLQSPFVTGITGTVQPGASGNGGPINITAGNLSLANAGAIESGTLGSGNGGSVSIHVTGRLSIVGSNLPGFRPTSISTQNFDQDFIGSGNAGQVTISSGSLSISNGGQISTATASPGLGGDIVVSSPTIILTGQGSHITANSTGTGNAGTITLSAANLTLQDDASIATQAATANGGNIVLRVGDFLHLTNSSITTSVLGANGNGGNITIDTPLLVLNHSSIIAQAVAGHGGNITIVADDFIPSADSIVSASSQLGVSGTIELIGPRVDLNGGLVVLSDKLRNPDQVVRTSCEATGRRRSRAESGQVRA